MSEPSLDELMSGEEPVDEIQEEKKVEDLPTEEDAGKGEETEPPSEPEDKAEPEKPETKEVPITALLDERDKRQKAERELEQLRSQQQPSEPVDPVMDPAGFQSSVNDQISAAMFQQDLKWMRRTYDDFDKAEAWINEQLGDNVALQARLQNSDNLLEDAYAMFKQHEKLEALEDADSAEARIRAEVEAELRKELGLEKKEQEEKAQSVEKAVTKPSVVSTGTSQSTAFEGELSLEDLMGSDFAHRPK